MFWSVDNFIITMKLLLLLGFLAVAFGKLLLITHNFLMHIKLICKLVMYINNSTKLL